MSKPSFTKLNPPERRRTYYFPVGEPGSENALGVDFENVVAVAVSENGTHLLETADGLKHIMATGWLNIELDVDDWTF